jgi:hypothetical protein
LLLLFSTSTTPPQLNSVAVVPLTEPARRTAGPGHMLDVRRRSVQCALSTAMKARVQQWSLRVTKGSEEDDDDTIQVASSPNVRGRKGNATPSPGGSRRPSQPGRRASRTGGDSMFGGSTPSAAMAAAIAARGGGGGGRRHKADCCVFFPTSPLRVSWDALLLVVLFVLLFILPFRFGFRDARLGPGSAASNLRSWASFDYFILTIFCLDIVRARPPSRPPSLHPSLQPLAAPPARLPPPPPDAPPTRPSSDAPRAARHL